MIEIQVYRFRIGLYTHNKSSSKGSKGKGKGIKNKGDFTYPHSNSQSTITSILAFIYIYFIVISYFVMASSIINLNFTSFSKIGYLMPSNEIYQSYTALFANIFLVSLVKISNKKRHFKLFSYFLSYVGVIQAVKITIIIVS